MKNEKGLSIIAAMSQNGVIGNKGSIPWHHPRDMRFFRKRTTGHVIIMGRKTFESIGRILPKRTHFVITRQEGYSYPGIFVFNDFEKAVDKALEKDDCPFVIGGSDIYKMALPYASKMYLTHIDKDVDGDTFFPEFDRGLWKMSSSKRDEDDDSLLFCEYSRIER